MPVIFFCYIFDIQNNETFSVDNKRNEWEFAGAEEEGRTMAIAV